MQTMPFSGKAHLLELKIISFRWKAIYESQQTQQNILTGYKTACMTMDVISSQTIFHLIMLSDIDYQWHGTESAQHSRLKPAHAQYNTRKGKKKKIERQNNIGHIL
jgi:hypothetical protein